MASAMETTRDLSMKNAAHHRDGTPVSNKTVKNDITGSGSIDIEKTSVQDQRSYLFFGKPMSILHELAFFAVVSTANFTPRGYFSIHSYSLSFAQAIALTIAPPIRVIIAIK